MLCVSKMWVCRSELYGSFGTCRQPQPSSRLAHHIPLFYVCFVCLGRPWDPSGVAYPCTGRPSPAAGRHYAGAAYPSASVPVQLMGTRSIGRCAAIPRWLGSLLCGIAALPLTGGAYAAAPPSPPQPAAVAPPSPCWEFKSQQERFERRTSRGNCTEAISEKISWLIYIL